MADGPENGAAPEYVQAVQMQLIPNRGAITQLDVAFPIETARQVGELIRGGSEPVVVLRDFLLSLHFLGFKVEYRMEPLPGGVPKQPDHSGIQVATSLPPLPSPEQIERGLRKLPPPGRG